MSASSISGTAFALSGGLLHAFDAKTTHGLLRGSERFTLTAVIDSVHAGKDAGVVMDGIPRNIPVFADLHSALAVLPKPDCCIIGVATLGGVLPPVFEETLREALRQGISVVNGLHDLLCERPDMAALAAAHGAQLCDVRKPKHRSELHFWTGAVYEVGCPIIAVIGTDCAVGKRTTARFIRDAYRKAGKRAEMIYTGQTGWMQGNRYGFIFDSTLNDFVSGELEHAIVSAWENERPDVLLLEGQSALRNPSGPCGPELLISGNAKHVVLVHDPKRKYYDHDPKWGEIPPVETEIELIRRYGAEVIALALNTSGCSPEEARQFKQHYAATLSLPVLLPLEEAVAISDFGLI